MTSVRQIELRRRVIDAAIARARALSDHTDAEAIQADYARYVCVLVSGYVERAVAELIMAYAEDKTPRQVQSFLESNLNRLTNVDKERLLNVIGSLDSNWREDLDQFVDDKRQAALNSVVGLRHNIAHGGIGSLSLNGIEGYWAVVQEIVDHVDALLFPPSTIVRARRR